MRNKISLQLVWAVPLCAISIMLLQTALGQIGPTGQPSPLPSPLWAEVTENRTCPSSTSCPAGRGFTIDQKGAYKSGRGASGKITTDELNRLISTGNAVANQDLSGELKCDASGGEANVNVILKKGDQSSVVYEGRADGTLCHRGETAPAIELKNELDRLAQKYDRGGLVVPTNVCAGRPNGTSCGENPQDICCDGKCTGSGLGICPSDQDECFGQPDGVPCGGSCWPVSCESGCFGANVCRQGSCQLGPQIACDQCSLLPDGTSCGRVDETFCPDGSLESYCDNICDGGTCSGAMCGYIGCSEFPPEETPPEEHPT